MDQDGQARAVEASFQLWEIDSNWRIRNDLFDPTGPADVGCQTLSNGVAIARELSTDCSWLLRASAWPHVAMIFENGEIVAAGCAEECRAMKIENQDLRQRVHAAYGTIEELRTSLAGVPDPDRLLSDLLGKHRWATQIKKAIATALKPTEPEKLTVRQALQCTEQQLIRQAGVGPRTIHSLARLFASGGYAWAPPARGSGERVK